MGGGRGGGHSQHLLGWRGGQSGVFCVCEQEQESMHERLLAPLSLRLTPPAWERRRSVWLVPAPRRLWRLIGSSPLLAAVADQTSVGVAGNLHLTLT